MIVPTYTASAKNVTGVPGQAMSFKVPGGALSQGQVAEAQFLGKVSSTAASWGGAFYGMHSSAVTSKAVTGATKSLDAAALEAQSKDVLAPNKKDQPSGWFANKANSILATATGASWDPFVQRDIAGLVSSQITTRQRETNKLSRLRIVKHDQAFLADRERVLRDQVARTVPENWDGDIDTLPAHGQSAYYDLQKMRKKAAGQGTIDYLQEQKGSEEDRSYITKLAISKRMKASPTSGETQKLLGQLQDGTSWRMLTEDDRDVLEWKLHRQVLRQQGREAATAKQQQIEKRRQLTKTQNDNQSNLQVRIYQARNGIANALMPTVMEIAKTQLTPGARTALMTMMLNEYPRETDADYFLEIHSRLRVMETAGLTSEQLEEGVNALQDEVLKEVTKKHKSRINDADALAFSSVLRSVRQKKGQGSVIDSIEKDLRLTLKKTKMGNVQDRELANLYAGIAKATRVLYHEGGTEQEALEAALSTMGRTRLRSPYPKALPIAEKMGVPSQTRLWKLEDHEAATIWLMNNQGAFTGPAERDETYEQMQDILTAIHERQAALDAAKAKKKEKKN